MQRACIIERELKRRLQSVWFSFKELVHSCSIDGLSAEAVRVGELSGVGVGGVLSGKLSGFEDYSVRMWRGREDGHVLTVAATNCIDWAPL